MMACAVKVAPASRVAATANVKGFQSLICDWSLWLADGMVGGSEVEERVHGVAALVGTCRLEVRVLHVLEVEQQRRRDATLMREPVGDAEDRAIPSRVECLVRFQVIEADQPFPADVVRSLRGRPERPPLA